MSTAFTLDGGASSPGMRQAALLLHGVDAEDREWLLNQLDGASRHVLDALLAELHAMGVPASTDMLGELVTHAESSPSLSPSLAPSEPEASLHNRATAGATSSATGRWTRAAPATLHALLVGEPDALVARALGLMDAPARAALLQRFEASRRRQIGECVSATTPPRSGGTRLDEAVQASLSERVAAASAASAPWQRARAWIGDALRQQARRGTVNTSRMRPAWPAATSSAAPSASTQTPSAMREPS